MALFDCRDGATEEGARMRFEIREFTAATVATVDGEIERSLGAGGAALESFDAAYPAAGIRRAIEILGDLGLDTSTYADVTECVTCCWFVSDSHLVALVPVAS